ALEQLNYNSQKIAAKAEEHPPAEPSPAAPAHRPAPSAPASNRRPIGATGPRARAPQGPRPNYAGQTPIAAPAALGARPAGARPAMGARPAGAPVMRPSGPGA